MKIAIIGSGISGLASSYLLKDKYEVTLFEKNDYFGGHSNTQNISHSGQEIPVDTGFIVFNHRTYKNLVPFFNELGVKTEASDMSFGISIKNKNLEYSGQNLASIFAQKKNIFSPKYLKMIRDILKFNSYSRLHYQDISNNVTLADYLEQIKVGEYFKKYYLLPMSGAIWSCPLATMLKYPAASFLSFFYNHGLLTVTDQPIWYTVSGGSKEYVKKIINQEKIKTKFGEITQIEKVEDQYLIVDKAGNREKFNIIILASAANISAKLLEKIAPKPSKILKKFKYQKNSAILHKDQSLMPVNKKAWASWVYMADESKNNNNNISVTYWMNNLQNIEHKYPTFVTLNPITEIAAQDIFYQTSYHHPIFDNEAIQAQSEIKQSQGKNNIYIAGAYLRYGFHEDGIISALNIANKLGVKAKWQ